MQFIERFSDCVETFEGELSYWFAYILFRRFILDGACIVFDKTTMVFATLVHGIAYNINGEASGDWERWVDVPDGERKSRMIERFS